MKKLNQNSKEAGINAQQYKHKHHEIIVKTLKFLKKHLPYTNNSSGFTPYRISARAEFATSKQLDVAAVYRRMSELVKLGLVEVTPTIGKTPHGRKCSCYRLKSKKK